MTPAALILQIAAAIGCSAVVVPAGADPVDYLQPGELTALALGQYDLTATGERGPQITPDTTKGE